MAKHVSPMLSVLGQLTGTIVASLVVASCSSEKLLINEESGPSPVPQPTVWQTYSDSRYGFAIRYPDDYEILREAGLPTPNQPPVVQRVSFQWKGIELDESELPAFSVDVFEHRPAISLSDWLRSHNLLPAGAGVTPMRLEGAGGALRVALSLPNAPNEFVYVSTDRYVYRLTPLGQHGEEMIASFRLFNPS
jgi:hypothetical protein